MAICYKNRFPRNVLEASRLEGILVEARIKHEIEHKEEWVVGQWRRATDQPLSSPSHTAMNPPKEKKS